MTCGGTDHGRPRLEGTADLSLSVSYSGRFVAAAICESAAVGVDIERRRPGLFGIASLLEADGEEECATLDDLLRMWVRKEAVLKSTGEGITRAMSSFSLQWDPKRERGFALDRFVADVRAPLGYRMAVAVPTSEDMRAGLRVRCYRELPSWP